MLQSRWAQNTFGSSFSNSATYDVRRKAQTPSDMVQTSAGWSDPALRLIDEVTNSMDVDFQAPSVSGIPSSQISLVLDTNVLLKYLDVLQQFVEDVDKVDEPIAITIPGIIVQELDYQKGDKSRDLCWPARMASTWILSKLKEHKHVKGQAYQETLQRSGTWKRRDPNTSNDDLIVDCCLYLREKKNHTVLAISQDNNFCSSAESQGIPTLNPRDYTRWSSRSLARLVLGDGYSKLNMFTDYKETFRPRRVREALDVEMGVQLAQDRMSDDGMEIDDEFAMSSEPPPQHILDDLHEQVLGHFTILLSELLRRTSPTLFTKERSRSGTTTSIYASSGLSKPAEDWMANEILVYLCNARRMPRAASSEDARTVANGSSRMADFFTHKYSARGRSGQHWSRADWTSCLETLGAVGRVYEDEATLNSLAQLAPQVELVFETPMRPL